MWLTDSMISLIAHLSIDIFIFGFLYDIIADRTNRNMNLLVEEPEISKKYNKFVLLTYNTQLIMTFNIYVWRCINILTVSSDVSI